MAIQGEWGEIQKIAARRFLFPEKMARIEAAFPQVPQELLVNDCDSQDVLIRMNQFKQLAEYTRAAADKRDMCLPEGDVTFLAPRLEGAIEAQALIDLGNALRKLYPETCGAKNPIEVRNWCLDLSHLDDLANATTLKITYAQILDLPVEVSSLLVGKKQAIEDRSLDALCSQISRQYPEIVFPATPEERRAWFCDPKNQEARQKITELDLSYKKLEVLPPEIGNLIALQKLNLKKNKLETLPPEIGNLLTLVKLNLKKNKLETLPSEIGNLTALKKLDLQKNNLTSLPREIGNLAVFLCLWGNKLETLSAEIGRLVEDDSLDKLCISITDQYGIEFPAGSAERRAWFCAPENQEVLKQVTTLDLFCKGLQSLPKEIGNLTALREVDLSINKLTTLPPEIGKLTALRKLELCQNKLETLPREIAQSSNCTIRKNKEIRACLEGMAEAASPYKPRYPLGKLYAVLANKKKRGFMHNLSREVNKGFNFGQLGRNDQEAIVNKMGEITGKDEDWIRKHIMHREYTGDFEKAVEQVILDIYDGLPYESRNWIKEKLNGRKAEEHLSLLADLFFEMSFLEPFKGKGRVVFPFRLFFYRVEAECRFLKKI